MLNGMELSAKDKTPDPTERKSGYVNQGPRTVAGVTHPKRTTAGSYVLAVRPGEPRTGAYRFGWRANLVGSAVQRDAPPGITHKLERARKTGDGRHQQKGIASGRSRAR